MPHYDALVLTLCISGFDVHRVLVDLGNAIDLLQIPVFNQMRLSLGMLNSAGQILFDFNGATTVTLGDVMLPVRVGLITQQVLFSVVEDLGHYNSIMGRAWLHSMKAVPSTYHQMVNYLIDVGQVDLLGSQLATRQCYQLSMGGTKREEELRNPSPQRSNPRIAITVCLLDQARGEGSARSGLPGKTSVGRAEEVHLCQFSSDR